MSNAVSRPEQRIPQRYLHLLERGFFAPIDEDTGLIPEHLLPGGGVTGPPGADGIFGWVSNNNGLSWVRAPGGGAWTPVSTSTTLTVKFYQGAIVLHERTLVVSFNTTTGAFSATAGTDSGITATLVGNNTSALTVIFTHDDSLAVVSAALSATLGGDDGADGADGVDGTDGVDGLDGIDGSSAKLVVLVCDSQTFQIPNVGSVTPSSITFTAHGQNLAGSPTFTVVAGTATLTGSGATRSLAYAGMSTEAITVKVTWDGQEDYISVVKVREGTDGTDGTDGSDGIDGADAVTSLLTNEAHNVPADVAGTVTSFAGAASQMKIFVGLIDDTSNWSISKADTNCTSSLVGATATVSALSADVGYVDFTATRTGYATQTKRFTIAKSKTGTTGAAGDPGPGVVYRGAYGSSTEYYHTATRRDVVLHGGSYYLTNNTGKNGLTTWGTPGGGDWQSFGATFTSIATGLLLTEDATILKTLTMGDGTTSNAGVIRSAGASAYGTGAGFWLGIDGTTPKFRIGNPSGQRFAYDGTNLDYVGTLNFGSGSTEVTVNSSGLRIGPSSGNRLHLDSNSGYTRWILYGTSGQSLIAEMAAGTSPQFTFFDGSSLGQLSTSALLLQGSSLSASFSAPGQSLSFHDIALARTSAGVCTLTGSLNITDFMNVSRGPHAGAVPSEFLSGVMHRHNGTSKWGMFVGTNWALAENLILRTASVDATTGAISPALDVFGDRKVRFYNALLDPNGDQVLGARQPVTTPAETNHAGSGFVGSDTVDLATLYTVLDNLGGALNEIRTLLQTHGAMGT